MATNKKQSVLGYDPLAWLGGETEEQVIEGAVQEAPSESSGQPVREEQLGLAEERITKDEALDEEAELPSARIVANEAPELQMESADEVIEGLTEAAEAVPEATFGINDETDIDDAVHALENANDPEILAAESSEIDMNAMTDLPEEQDSDKEAAVEPSGPVVDLDATLTMQNVAGLYEKLKSAYRANDSLVINASQVASIDTATLQLLVSLKKDAVKNQRSVIFDAPSLRFTESAELLGLLEILEIEV